MAGESPRLPDHRGGQKYAKHAGPGSCNRLARLQRNYQAPPGVLLGISFFFFRQKAGPLTDWGTGAWGAGWLPGARPAVKRSITS